MIKCYERWYQPKPCKMLAYRWFFDGWLMKCHNCGDELFRFTKRRMK